MASRFHDVRYVGGGVFVVEWFTPYASKRGRPKKWFRRSAIETDRGAAVRFVRRWNVQPNRLLAIDLGLEPPLTDAERRLKWDILRSNR